MVNPPFAMSTGPLKTVNFPIDSTVAMSGPSGRAAGGDRGLRRPLLVGVPVAPGVLAVRGPTAPPCPGAGVVCGGAGVRGPASLCRARG